MTSTSWGGGEWASPELAQGRRTEAGRRFERIAMRKIFVSDEQESEFLKQGYVLVDLLDNSAVSDLWNFYAEAFQARRPVVDYAQQLPYYISVFDKDTEHKQQVDRLISGYVGESIRPLMIDYEVFYSNFMIKFPGDGQIEAHQDFNFVDETEHVAFNLWCPLVDTGPENGGLYVIPGSHRAFRTQRGPNLPKALTEYNDLLKKFGHCLPTKKGQAVIFDHKLIHYSSPNGSDGVRVAIQSVLKPVEAQAVHYVFDAGTDRIKAYRIDREFVLQTNLWDANLDRLELDHEQALIPLLTSREMVRRLVELRLADGRNNARPARIFRDEAVQQEFSNNGFVKLPVLGAEDVARLTELFRESTGGTVDNTEYGIYIGLEDRNLERKRALIGKITEIAGRNLGRHFQGYKTHLGSFLVKAPGEDSYTYPHQDWTFVDPPHVSVTVWIALVDTNEGNGALGFVKGSHNFFDKLVGSPSPEFRTCTQGHETALYEYLSFVPLRAGEAVAFDNRTIHGATPNRTTELRTAVAIGVTPTAAQLFHYFLLQESAGPGRRRVAKLKVEEEFFEKYSLAALKACFLENQIPGYCTLDAVIEEDFVPFTSEELVALCEAAGLSRNGAHLTRGQTRHPDAGLMTHVARRLGAMAGWMRKAIAGA